jgi:putative SOS response-associated peptidase YedK
MCGRYVTTRGATRLSEVFEAYDETDGRLTARYNVAPTNAVPVVRQATDAPPGGTAPRLLSLARWGLVPHWARDPRGGARMINARSETVATTRAYAPSFARRRCLVPADGWYEWTRHDGVRQAFYLTPRDGRVLAFAGIWSVWEGAGESLLTCSVLTTAAAGELTRVHERMPLLLPAEHWAQWLADPAQAADLLAPVDPDTLAGIEIRPVGPAVGNVRNDGPGLIARAASDVAGDRDTLTLF